MDDVPKDKIEKQYQNIKKKNGKIGRKLSESMEALKSGYHENAILLGGNILQSILRNMWRKEDIPGNAEDLGVEKLLEGLKGIIEDQLMRRYFEEIGEASQRADKGEHLEMEDAFEMLRKLCSVVMWYLGKYQVYDQTEKIIGKKGLFKSRKIPFSVYILSLIFLITGFISYLVYENVKEDRILKEWKTEYGAQSISNARKKIIKIEKSDLDVPNIPSDKIYPLRNSSLENLDETSIVLEIRANNLFDVIYNPTGSYHNNFQIELFEQGKIVKDKKYNLMWISDISPGRMNYSSAESYIYKLNKEEYHGFSDWRIPTIIELYSIVYPTKSIEEKYISSYFDERLDYVWSIDMERGDYLYCMAFKYGTFCTLSKKSSIYLIPVRNIDPEKYNFVSYPDRIESLKRNSKFLSLRSKPISRLDKFDIKLMVKFYNFFDSEINKKGSFPNKLKSIHIKNENYIVDFKNNLMWYCARLNSQLNWFKSRMYIDEFNNKDINNYHNWRLPTLEELYSLVEMKPDLNDNYISNIFSSKITSCCSADSRDLKYCYYLNYRKGYSDYTSKTSSRFDPLMLVRTIDKGEASKYLKNEK